MRTSDTDPLLIDSFDLARGKVGMTLCPGRKGPSASGGWARDLRADVLQLQIWRTDIVISLTEAAEMADLGVSGMAAALCEAGILWLHLPIPDTQAPPRGWHEDWRRVSPAIHRRLEAGGRVVIHCKAGLERTALVATLLQCERGETITEALRVIRGARKSAGLLPAQRRWLEDLVAEDGHERHT